MKKIVRLTEGDLVRIIKKVISENELPKLKIDSVNSAIYTTCNPKVRSTWYDFKKTIESTELNKVNWETVFKESSAGSKFGIQGKYIWAFSQSTYDGNTPGRSNFYNFYDLANDGIIGQFATVKYGCPSNAWIYVGNKPRINNDREWLLPPNVMFQLTRDFDTSYDGKIPNDVVLQLLKLIEAQPDLNTNVAQAISMAKKGTLFQYQGVKDEELKSIKNHPLYKAIGGV